jgi:hypothetical protein
VDQADAREWDAPRFSFPIANNLLGVAFGLLFLGAGVAHLVGQPGHVGVAGSVCFVIGGVFSLAVNGGCLVVPARHVRLGPGGTITFTGFGRRLAVAPGELQRVTALFFDRGRIWPYRVTSADGTILLAPRMRDMPALAAALSAQNPQAQITLMVPRGIVADRVAASRAAAMAQE